MLLTHITPLLLSTALLTIPSTACDVHRRHATLDHTSTITANIQARSKRQSTAAPPAKIALDNVRVFDGYKVQRPSTVIISNGAIVNSNDCKNATHIDGRGFVLLPGLIDAHCHPTTVAHLESMAKHGITTGLIMSCFSSEMCTSLTNHPGLPDLQFASAPASAPGSTHGNLTAMIDPTLLLNNASEIPKWMDHQLSSSLPPNYIKLIAETPGFTQATLTALVAEAKKRGKKTVTHAATLEAYTQAIKAKSAHIHHTPLDTPLPPTSPLLKTLKQNAQTATPTLTMMRSIARSHPTANYTAALLTTRALHAAHIPLLAGTDANEVPGVPAAVAFGSSMHDELDDLIEAGLSSLEALRAATVGPAVAFGLHDRGVVGVGMRADLVLVEGNPLVDIRALRRVRRVWVAGVEVMGL